MEIVQPSDMAKLAETESRRMCCVSLRPVGRRVYLGGCNRRQHLGRPVLTSQSPAHARRPWLLGRFLRREVRPFEGHVRTRFEETRDTEQAYLLEDDHIEGKGRTTRLCTLVAELGEAFAEGGHRPPRLDELLGQRGAEYGLFSEIDEYLRPRSESSG